MFALSWGRSVVCGLAAPLSFFFFNDTATTEIYTLSLHDALPILGVRDHDGHQSKRWTLLPDQLLPS